MKQAEVRMTDIVQKLRGFCRILDHEGVDCGDYMVKRAVRDAEPLLTSQEPVGRAFDKLTAGQTFSTDQQVWLGRTRAHFVENLAIDRGDFDLAPVLERAGGWTAAERAFKGKLAQALREVNEAIAA